MDLPHLVRTSGRLIRHPAAQFLALGLAAFLLLHVWRPGFEQFGWGKPALVIAPHQLVAARRAFTEERARLPTPQEEQALLERLIDDEILFQYALAHGMEQDPVVIQRLAQVARFVRVDRDGVEDQQTLAERAKELGLHTGDLVTRRVLADAARRLIRAVVLLSEPETADLRAYHQAHPDAFQQPAWVSLHQLAFDGWARDARPLETATTWYETLQATGALTHPEVPAALAAHLSRLEHQREADLARRFGARFAAGVFSAPGHRWTGPLPSLHGYHLVFVTERVPRTLRPFEEVRAEVRDAYLRALADEWLALRLRELRAVYRVQLPTPGT